MVDREKLFKNYTDTRNNRVYARAEASEELEFRGWTRSKTTPGVWIDRTGHAYAWFNAVKREGITFDPKDKPWQNV